jgi:UDP-N-acetylmuramoyl-tripeptide--D-alanyl-D-alanine ligase
VEGDALVVTGLGATKAQRYGLPLPGGHNARNLLAAITTAKGMGLSWEEIREGLATFKGVAGRSQLETLFDGKTVALCDYYNANPDSMAAGLRTLGELAHARGMKRKIAALADMKETGTEEKQLHRALAGQLKDFAVVYLCGPLMKELVDELAKTGFRGEVAHFPDSKALGARLKTVLRQGDAVIFKGSHSMAMENAWAAVK